MPGKRSSRLAVAVIACLTMLGALAACGNEGPRVWALEDGILNTVEEGSIDRFNNTDPEDALQLQTFGNDPFKDRLRTALGSESPPDVFFNWGGGGLLEYVEAGQVQDLSPLFEQNPELEEAFIPSVLETARFDGRYYGVPMRGMQPVVLYYNKAVFEEANVAPPETYADLLSLVDTFRDRGITPIALAGRQSWTELMWAEYLLDRVGGPDVFTAIRNGEEGAWEHPAVLEAMRMVRELVDRGAFGDNFATVEFDDGAASALLAEGRAAMHLMGTWEYTNQADQNPEFFERGDLGFVPFPALGGGEGDPANVVGGPTNYYSIASGTQYQAVAENFVTTQLHDPEYISGLIEIGDVPAITGLEDELAESENAEHAVWIYELVQEAPSFQLSWDQDLPSEQATLMLEQLEALFLGDQTPQGFVDTLAGSQG